jgi:hypothetical protein
MAFRSYLGTARPVQLRIWGNQRFASSLSLVVSERDEKRPDRKGVGPHPVFRGRLCGRGIIARALQFTMTVARAFPNPIGNPFAKPQIQVCGTLPHSFGKVIKRGWGRICRNLRVAPPLNSS